MPVVLHHLQMQQNVLKSRPVKIEGNLQLNEQKTFAKDQLSL